MIYHVKYFSSSCECRMYTSNMRLSFFRANIWDISMWDKYIPLQHTREFQACIFSILTHATHTLHHNTLESLDKV